MDRGAEFTGEFWAYKTALQRDAHKRGNHDSHDDQTYPIKPSGSGQQWRTFVFGGTGGEVAGEA
eukprot:231673-Prorocentrum_lima.AAC.1